MAAEPFFSPSRINCQVHSTSGPLSVRPIELPFVTTLALD